MLIPVGNTLSPPITGESGKKQVNPATVLLPVTPVAKIGDRVHVQDEKTGTPRWEIRIDA